MSKILTLAEMIKINNVSHKETKTFRMSPVHVIKLNFLTLKYYSKTFLINLEFQTVPLLFSLAMFHY